MKAFAAVAQKACGLYDAALLNLQHLSPTIRPKIGCVRHARRVRRYMSPNEGIVWKPHLPTLASKSIATPCAWRGCARCKSGYLTRTKVLCEEPPEYPPERVVSLLTRVAKMTQAVFASFMNVSVSTVQKWESPSADKRPSGAAAKLLQLVESKGVDALIV